MSELKPCSCCGFVGAIYHHNGLVKCENTIKPCPLSHVWMKVEDWNHRPEEDKLNDRIKELKNNVMAFAGQLQAWGCDKCAEEAIKEILGNDVNAPDYYAQKNHIKELETAVIAIGELISSNYLMTFPDIKRVSVIISEVLDTSERG